MLVERVELQLTVVVDRQQPEVGAGPLGDVLPRNEVRVVLELGHEHDVARPEVVEAPGVGDEVDPLGRAAGEDHLARGRRVDELARRLARALVPLGRPLGEQVDAAVHVRVRGLVEVADRVQHLPRLLRAGRRVEIGERLAVDLLLEDREVGAQLLRVEGWASRHGHRAIVPRHRVMKLSAATALLSTILLLAAGCGGSGTTSSSPGAKVFASAGCGAATRSRRPGRRARSGPTSTS